MRLARVCGLDAMLTLECCSILDRILKPSQKEHYRFNLSLLPSVLYSMLEGLPFDKVQARRDLKELERAIYATQYEIDRAAWEAVGGGATSPDEGSQQHGIRHGMGGGDVQPAPHPSPRTARLARLFGTTAGGREGRLRGDEMLERATEAFAKARRVEKARVVEERWQPMRWGGRRWVKDGKLVKSIPLECYDAGKGVVRQVVCKETSPIVMPSEEWPRWLKPSPRTVEVSRTVPVDSWDTLERFCKESARTALKRVRKLAKELEHAQRNLKGELERQDNRPPDQPPAGQGDTGVLPAAVKAILGELSILFGVAVNSNANNQGGDTQWLLHEAWGLPKKVKKVVKVEEDEAEVSDPRLTTDASMLLSLYARCQQPGWAEWRRHSKLRGDELKAWLDLSSVRLKLVLRMRKLVKERSYLDVATDSDGKVRYGLNLVQAATGRFAAYGSPTGRSRLNPQTVGKKHRHLYTYGNQ
jgi:hypothetical protein